MGIATQEKRNLRTDEEDSIKYYFDEINRTPLLNFEEEKFLSKRILKGDKRALEKLIKANLRLVVKISKQYVTKDYQIMDIIQDGNLGLIKAAEKYDYRRAVRFSTYASWWIKQSIVRSLSLKKRMIRIPHRKEEKLRLIRKTWNSLNQNLRHAPTIEEIAHELNMDEHEIETLLALANPVVSFENTLLSEDCALFNILEDYSFAPEQLVLEKTLKRETSDVLRSLIPKERMVLSCRYGFENDKKYTLKNMGEHFGISAETVRQIEMKALRHIREKHAHLREYLELF
jgi:RNA polymerase primary sigma factor